MRSAAWGFADGTAWSVGGRGPITRIGAVKVGDSASIVCEAASGQHWGGIRFRVRRGRIGWMESPQGKAAPFTIDDYLRLEAGAAERHEFRDGQIIAMSGGSAEHSLIIANVIRHLGNRLDGKPCRVYDSNLRVRIPRTPLYTYPDVSVICGPTQFDAQDPNRTTATNPRLIVEVLSDSTEAYDRGDKFRRYRSMESFQEYVLASQVRPWVETFLRQGDGSWRFASASGVEGIVRLGSLQIEIPLVEIYAGVEFPPEPEQLQLF